MGTIMLLELLNYLIVRNNWKIETNRVMYVFKFESSSTWHDTNYIENHEYFVKIPICRYKCISGTDPVRILNSRLSDKIKGAIYWLVSWTNQRFRVCGVRYINRNQVFLSFYFVP